MAESFALNVNGVDKTVEVDGKTPLLFVLRHEFGCMGVRHGCGEGYCGACTVKVNGKAMQSCSTPIWSLENPTVTTVEGLAEKDPLIEAFIEEQAAQCAFCVPGIIMTVRALLDENPSADLASIKRELAERNLCRCGAHARMLRAIHRVLAASDEGSGE